MELVSEQDYFVISNVVATALWIVTPLVYFMRS